MEHEHPVSETAPATTPEPKPVKEETQTPGVMIEAETWEEAPVTATSVPIPVVASLAIALLASLVLVRLSRLRLMERLARWFVPMHVLIWVIALIVCMSTLISAMMFEWLTLGVISLGLLMLVSLGWVRSVFAGVALSLEHRVRLGDLIRVGEIHGEVVGVGLRAVSIRAEDGTVHDIPNARFMTESVSNLSGGSGDSACDLIVPIPEGLPSQMALEIALEAAIVSPLASPRHKPQVFLLPPTKPEETLRLSVHGYAFDATYQEHFRSDVLHRMLEAFEVKRAKLTP